MATVDLIDVTKTVGATSILHQLTLSIKKGEFMVVVGPSGCGKSTLLRLIAGLEQLSSGAVLINNQCVNDMPAAKRDMAMVFQNYALYPHMTVFDNMAYGLKMRKLSASDIRQRVSDVAKLLHLTPYLQRKPQELSGGQKQRVAMGRAIVRSPAVYLFDEPLSNLDAKLRTEMRHEIKKLHQQFNTTSLYVTHDQTEAMTMADRVLVLNQGRVEQLGTPQELYQTPATEFVAGFTGHYPINFFTGVFDKKSKTIQTEMGIDFPAPLWTDTVDDHDVLTLAVRPEHVLHSASKNAQSLELNIEFIDDMGADKLVQAKSINNGKRVTLRLPADHALSDGQIFVELPKMKVHVFHQKTGKRIGEWCGEERH
ncbi:ABC transporter ATP-binding protein [Legionella worsleiensis]|uniref:sn-glycerol-3-phosphate transport, ATP binding protein n=1 Tax=Legionella worsleiensis TaxID=45076 RepID=A0A0W1A437_9GAMM|nr:sn-glycerol-3-phosphate ABC transporter ATP-binding protein UgpC [Legionella worsleiensis]KTD76129.1 sn-glycerol-3-phosphate transport, ATP binding protein [Legionella worsleiensis]STY33293.1 sn-glycerol 3-phosphate transport system ATP-binding protein [Legionella worsleiensis]